MNTVSPWATGCLFCTFVQIPAHWRSNSQLESFSSVIIFKNHQVCLSHAHMWLCIFQIINLEILLFSVLTRPHGFVAGYWSWLEFYSKKYRYKVQRLSSLLDVKSSGEIPVLNTIYLTGSSCSLNWPWAKPHEFALLLSKDGKKPSCSYACIHFSGALQGQLLKPNSDLPSKFIWPQCRCLKGYTPELGISSPIIPKADVIS